MWSFQVEIQAKTKMQRHAVWHATLYGGVLSVLCAGFLLLLPSGSLAAEAASGSFTGWGKMFLWLRGGASLLGVALGWKWLKSGWHTNRISGPGLEVISTSQVRRLLHLSSKSSNLEFLNDLFVSSKLRVSKGLDRVYFSLHRRGHALLEDKNFRNVLLHNRHRLRQVQLFNDDVLDVGELTLLYRDHNLRLPDEYLEEDSTHVQVSFRPPVVPLPKGTPTFVSMRNNSQVFYITKNVVFIGASSINDLVLKSSEVSLRHAKLERISGQYKLVQLNPRGNTTVNRRRVDEQYLRIGDKVEFEGEGFLFVEGKQAVQPAREHRQDQISSGSIDDEGLVDSSVEPTASRSSRSPAHKARQQPKPPQDVKDNPSEESSQLGEPPSLPSPPIDMY